MSQDYQSHEVVHGARFESEGLVSRSEEIHRLQAAPLRRRTVGLEAVSDDPRYRVRRQDLDGVDDVTRLLPASPMPACADLRCQSGSFSDSIGWPQLSQARSAVRPDVGRP